MDDSTKEKGIELLGKLSQAHGASGQENEVRRIFRSELGEGTSTDRAGNIFCECKGNSGHPRILIAAHMDEVGLMVQTITADGLIRFLALGGWWTHTLLAKRVRIRTGEGIEIPGVIGAKPPHFLSEAEREKVMKIEDMFIDVGARDADEVRAFGIRLGDTVVPDSPFVRMHNPDLLLSKAFDDRAGLSLVVHAALEAGKIPHPNTIIFAGTVQEEVGTRGARAAASSAAPDMAIVVEGSPADDLPGTSSQERQVGHRSGTSGPFDRFIGDSQSQIYRIRDRDGRETVCSMPGRSEENGGDRRRPHPPARLGRTDCGHRGSVALRPHPQHDNRHLGLPGHPETLTQVDRNPR